MSASEDLDLLVTDEYFDYLQSEADRPTRAPDPKMVDFFRQFSPAVTAASAEEGR